MSAASVEAARRFMAAGQFAVAGASQDTAKYGYKLLLWYHQRNLAVVPINPRAPSINVPATGGTSYATVASPSALPDPAGTALSIVTPPAATLGVLRDAKQAGVKHVWLQPGSFDEEGLKFAREQFESGVAGEEEQAGGEGWCVLLHGDEMRGAQKKGTGAGQGKGKI